MNKAELIEGIASGADLSKADAKKALDAFIDTTTKSLKKGDRVSLVGFGSFSVTERSARKGRNPQTGKEIQIPAKKVVKFKAGAELSDKVK
jgi:DNA-binding protein HU-beta